MNINGEPKGLFVFSVRTLGESTPWGFFSSHAAALEEVADLADPPDGSHKGDQVYEIARYKLDDPDDTVRQWYYDNYGEPINDTTGWIDPVKCANTGEYEPGDIVIVKAFPYCPQSCSEKEVLGVVTDDPNKDHPEYPLYCVKFVNAFGFLDQLHVAELALRPVTKSEAAALDPFLKFWIIGDSMIPKTLLSLAERKLYPVKNAQSVEDLQLRAKLYGQSTVGKF